MDNKKILKKSRQVNRGEMTRIDQLKLEQQEKELQDQQYAVQDNMQNFIDNDISQIEEQSKKRIRRTKHIKPNKMPQKTQNTPKTPKNDQQSKQVLESLIQAQQQPRMSHAQKLQIEEKMRSLKKRHSQKHHYSKSNQSHKKVNKQSDFLFQKFQQEQKKEIELVESGQQELDFFVTEIVSDVRNNSILYLFGKVKKNDKFITGCVKVSGIQREIIFMPRKGSTSQNVQEEFSDLLSKQKKKIPMIFSHPIKKYCFEMDVDYRNEEVNVFQVQYSFKEREMSWLQQQGNTYKGVFGLSYTPMEIFILKTRIRGSDWIKIKNYSINRSHKKDVGCIQIEVNDYLQDIQANYNQNPPKFNIGVINLDLNSGNNKIQSIYYSIYSDYDIITHQYQYCDSIIFTQDKQNTKFPQQQPNHKIHLQEFDSEYSMLTNFHRTFYRSDPDLLMGHEINSTILEIHLNRALTLLIDCSWLGRLTKPQKDIKHIKNIKYQLKDIFPGRLILDIRGLAQSQIKLNSYALLDLIDHFFNNFRFNSSPQLTKIQQNEKILQIQQKMDLLSLTLNLSQISGCTWDISLKESRAVRIGYLLMHKFYDADYIVPDNVKNFNKKRQKYEGGKVLEPKVGFYDNYVILVDFNSLYPSIIRQFKICFTSVIRNFIEPGYSEAEQEDLNFMSDQNGPLNQILADKNTSPILPNILENLIMSRKEVKREMKKAEKQKKSREIVQQLNIKQLALKLIANSIYGCLGFSSSRFYAKKMAMLITCFGRKLLQSSIDLVEGKGYSVIYGDTDSIMVNTLKNDIYEAIEEGTRLKIDINKQFSSQRSKGQILQVELDGVYKRMLLLKKKKYAGLMVTNYEEIKNSAHEIKEQCKLEIKGLDMVRRDWSLLTKEVGNVVLNKILNNDIDSIKEYLQNVNKKLIQYQNDQQMEIEGEMVIALRHFIIKKQLQKKISQYSEGNTLPHVKVARDMKKIFNKNDQQLVNHYIPFIITEGSDGNQAARAFHPTEYNQSLTSPQPLKIDFEFYKQNQLVNPLERLLRPLEKDGLDIDLNAIFGLKKENRVENQNDDVQYNKAKGELAHIYRRVYLDLKDFVIQQEGVSEYSYQYDQSIQFDVYFNRICIQLKQLISKYRVLETYCKECDFSTKNPIITQKCPQCEQNTLKQTNNSKKLTAKLLLFQNLVNDQMKTHSLIASYQQKINNLLQKTIETSEYENKQVLKPFNIFRNQFPEIQKLALQ